jgi:hypothetical protein
MPNDTHQWRDDIQAVRMHDRAWMTWVDFQNVDDVHEWYDDTQAAKMHHGAE